MWQPVGQVWVVELSGGSMEETNTIVIGIFQTLDKAKLYVSECFDAGWVQSKWNECRWESDSQSVTIFPHDLL